MQAFIMSFSQQFVAQAALTGGRRQCAACLSQLLRELARFP